MGKYFIIGAVLALSYAMMGFAIVELVDGVEWAAWFLSFGASVAGFYHVWLVVDAVTDFSGED